MSQTVSPSTSRSYGLARISRAWSISRASVYRFLNRTPSLAIARRPGLTGPCPDADLADHIRREIEASDFHGEGYYPVNVLNAIKMVPEVCRIFCATANPVEVVVAETDQGRGLLGVIDGLSPKGIEGDDDVASRKHLLRQFGYKL